MSKWTSENQKKQNEYRNNHPEWYMHYKAKLRAKTKQIEFNIEVTKSETPFITETEIIYENDENKLFQIIGINDTNMCLIKEVGHYSDSKKDYNILIHQMKINQFMK